MKILCDKTYNPKIDYLICKQLVKTLPTGYDEDRIRNCYINCTQAVEPYEKDLMEIKAFFNQNDILQVTNNMVERLYKICTHEDVYIKNDVSILMRNDLHDIAMFVNQIDCQRNTLFQLLFFIQYCIKYHSPIIPYNYLCDRLFYAVIANDVDDTEHLFAKLQNRTQKYMVKHSIEDGRLCIQRLYENRDIFIDEIDAMQIGYYGSYARGNENEYSDFDMLVVFSDDKNLSLYKRKSIDFWRSKMPIEIDIAAINESNFDSLPIGIKRSVRFI